MMGELWQSLCGGEGDEGECLEVWWVIGGGVCPKGEVVGEGGGVVLVMLGQYKVVIQH